MLGEGDLAVHQQELLAYRNGRHSIAGISMLVVTLHSKTHGFL